MKHTRLLVLAALLAFSAAVSLAQYRCNPQAGTARDIHSFDSQSDPPTWTNAPAFQKDVWTFTRMGRSVKRKT